MTKFRRSFLVIWVAAVTLVAVLGPDVAMAARQQWRGQAPSKAPVRRTIGPCAGEPDNGNNGAPIKVTTPTMSGHLGTSWFLDQAVQLMWKRQFKHSSRTR